MPVNSENHLFRAPIATKKANITKNTDVQRPLSDNICRTLNLSDTVGILLLLMLLTITDDSFCVTRNIVGILSKIPHRSKTSEIDINKAADIQIFHSG